MGEAKRQPTSSLKAGVSEPDLRSANTQQIPRASRRSLKRVNDATGTRRSSQGCVAGMDV